MENLLEITSIDTRTINEKANEYTKKIVLFKNEELITELSNNSWEKLKKNKKSYTMGLKKKHNIAFEERVWALFARLKFDYISVLGKFKLGFKSGLSKQIDVFAADNETILIVECKSTYKRKKVSYQKDISELYGIKEDLRTAAQKLFKGKQKIAFIFATNNAIISDNDRKRLSEFGILHFNQDTIEYFEQLAEHLGNAGKYQLIGKIFENQKIPEMSNRVPAVKGTLGKYDYYSFSIEPATLLKIGYIFHRTDVSDGRLHSYQRLVKKSRMLLIKSFLEDDGFFPNSVIINIDTKRVKFERAETPEHDSSTQLGVLYLPQLYRSAFIIDGQHRLYGYAHTDFADKRTIPVVAFINLPVDIQSKMFVDINYKQVKVTPNLLHSIQAEFYWESKDPNYAFSALKTRLINELDSDDRSPFYKRFITTEQKKSEKRCLTLKTIKDWAFSKSVNYFAKIKGKEVINYGTLWDGSYEKSLEKSKDFFITLFRQIEEELPDMWELGNGQGGFVSMNIGVASIIRIADDVLNYLCKDGSLNTHEISGVGLSEKLSPYISEVTSFIQNLEKHELKNMRSMFGTGSVSKVLREYQNVVNLKFTNYNPEGLSEWQLANTGVFTKKAHDLGHNQFEPIIHDRVISLLKKKWNEYEDQWWIEGVPVGIQKKCSNDKIEKKSSQHESSYLDLIHYRDIIITDWQYFEPYFAHPEVSAQSSKDKRSGWIHEFNSIRQKYSHPQRENVTEDEYNWLEKNYRWFNSIEI